MGNVLTYKGYSTTVEVDVEDGFLYGSVIGMKDGIYFEGSTPQEAKAMFHEAVDDYLQHCEETGKEPEKPFKGSFNVRIGPDLHRQAALAAASRKESLNQFVAKAIAAAL